MLRVEGYSKRDGRFAPFFTRGRHKDLDVWYLSHTFSDLPERTIRNYGNRKTFSKQISKDTEYIFADLAGFDMSNEEFKDFCSTACEDFFLNL